MYTLLLAFALADGSRRLDENEKKKYKMNLYTDIYYTIRYGICINIKIIFN